MFCHSNVIMCLGESSVQAHFWCRSWQQLLSSWAIAYSRRPHSSRHCRCQQHRDPPKSLRTRGPHLISLLGCAYVNVCKKGLSNARVVPSGWCMLTAHSFFALMVQERSGADALPAQLEATFAYCRGSMRAANGIKVCCNGRVHIDAEDSALRSVLTVWVSLPQSNSRLWHGLTFRCSSRCWVVGQTVAAAQAASTPSACGPWLAAASGALRATLPYATSLPPCRSFYVMHTRMMLTGAVLNGGMCTHLCCLGRAEAYAMYSLSFLLVWWSGGRETVRIVIQVGKTLADSLHQSAGGSLHRMAVSTADAGASPPPPHTTWHSHYNELALQLVASTTTAGSLQGNKSNCLCAEML